MERKDNSKKRNTTSLGDEGRKNERKKKYM